MKRQQAEALHDYYDNTDIADGLSQRHSSDADAVVLVRENSYDSSTKRERYRLPLFANSVVV